MSERRGWNPLLALGLVLGVFVVASLAAKTLPRSLTARHPWAAQAVLQGLMAAVAIGAIAASRRPFAEFGFRRPKHGRGRYVLSGLVLGAASTGVMVAFSLPGLRARLAAYNLPQVVLWIWLVSSTAEEIFCRGWFQSLVAGPSGAQPRDEPARAPLVWSAVLFGAMHLSLLFAGVDIASVAVVVVSVTAVGYVCATARARTGSLVPAIAAHMAFNVGGFLSGVISVIAYRLATGHLPPVR